MKPNVAVIQFPGSNCERETAAAVTYYGCDVKIIRWNVLDSVFKGFDAYVLPGGFSYQDRVRSGVISAKLPVIRWLQEADAAGKPILGICNGCQILAEAGLIPNLGATYDLEVALAPNQKEEDAIGFVCDWTFVRISNPEKNVFTKRFSPTDVIPVPINHGDGRFVLSDKVQQKLQSLTTLKYCDADGRVDATFPITRNGSDQGIAAIGNVAGNVLAMMPHPERAAFPKQVPDWVHTQKEVAPWAKLFESLCFAVQVRV